MINIPEAVKTLLKQDSVYKNLHITFPNGENPDINNDQIETESMSFTESICSRDEIKFGLAEAATFEVDVHGINNIKDQAIYAELQIDASTLDGSTIIPITDREIVHYHGNPWLNKKKVIYPWIPDVYCDTWMAARNKNAPMDVVIDGVAAKLYIIQDENSINPAGIIKWMSNKKDGCDLIYRSNDKWYTETLTVQFDIRSTPRYANVEVGDYILNALTGSISKVTDFTYVSIGDFYATTLVGASYIRDNTAPLYNEFMNYISPIAERLWVVEDDYFSTVSVLVDEGEDGTQVDVFEFLYDTKVIDQEYLDKYSFKVGDYIINIKDDTTSIIEQDENENLTIRGLCSTYIRYTTSDGTTYYATGAESGVVSNMYGATNYGAPYVRDFAGSDFGCDYRVLFADDVAFRTVTLEESTWTIGNIIDPSPYYDTISDNDYFYYLRNGSLSMSFEYIYTDQDTGEYVEVNMAQGVTNMLGESSMFYMHYRDFIQDMIYTTLGSYFTHIDDKPYYVIPLGTFKVDSCDKENDSDKRHIVAYTDLQKYYSLPEREARKINWHAVKETQYYPNMAAIMSEQFEEFAQKFENKSAPRIPAKANVNRKAFTIKADGTWNTKKKPNQSIKLYNGFIPKGSLYGWTHYDGEMTINAYTVQIWYKSITINLAANKTTPKNAGIIFSSFSPKKYGIKFVDPGVRDRKRDEYGWTSLMYEKLQNEGVDFNIINQFAEAFMTPAKARIKTFKDSLYEDMINYEDEIYNGFYYGYIAYINFFKNLIDQVGNFDYIEYVPQSETTDHMGRSCTNGYFKFYPFIQIGSSPAVILKYDNDGSSDNLENVLAYPYLNDTTKTCTILFPSKIVINAHNMNLKYNDRDRPTVKRQRSIPVKKIEIELDTGSPLAITQGSIIDSLNHEFDSGEKAYFEDGIWKTDSFSFIEEMSNWAELQGLFGVWDRVKGKYSFRDISSTFASLYPEDTLYPTAYVEVVTTLPDPPTKDTLYLIKNGTNYNAWPSDMYFNNPGNNSFYYKVLDSKSVQVFEKNETVIEDYQAFNVEYENFDTGLYSLVCTFNGNTLVKNVDYILSQNNYKVIYKIFNRTNNRQVYTQTVTVNIDDFRYVSDILHCSPVKINYTSFDPEKFYIGVIFDDRELNRDNDFSFYYQMETVSNKEKMVYYIDIFGFNLPYKCPVGIIPDYYAGQIGLLFNKSIEPAWPLETPYSITENDLELYQEILYPMSTGTRLDKSLIYLNGVDYMDKYTDPIERIIYYYGVIVDDSVTDYEESYPDGADTKLNYYSIVSNPLVKQNVSKTKATARNASREMARKLLDVIKHIYYMPSSTECMGMPYLTPSDSITVETDHSGYETIIFRRTLSGIQTLKDTFESR